MNKFKILHIVLVLLASTYVAKATPEEDAACCPPGYTFFKRNTTCLDVKTNINRPISLISNHTATMAESDLMTFVVDHNGQLLVKLKNREPTEYATGSFCMATHTITDKHNVTKTKRFAVLSYTADLNETVLDASIRGYCMVVSSIFLLFIAVIFACRQELRAHQGVSIINLCLSLGLGLGILAMNVLIPYSDMNLCTVRGFLVYFFLMASFFWMNVMSLQILKSARFSGPARACERTGGQCRWYAMYAWGVPAVFTIIMAIVNFMPGEHLKPGIGLNTCWFFNSKQQWIYMYSVMSILIAVNIGIFAYVTRLLWSGQGPLKYKILMTMRLFVMTGVLWIHEIISSLMPNYFAWYVLDIVNTLQGVTIFIVLVLFPLLLRKANAYHGLKVVISQIYTKIYVQHSPLPRCEGINPIELCPLR